MIMGRVRRKILVGCVKVERNCCDKGIKQVKQKKISLHVYLELDVKSSRKFKKKNKLNDEIKHRYLCSMRLAAAARAYWL